MRTNTKWIGLLVGSCLAAALVSGCATRSPFRFGGDEYGPFPPYYTGALSSNTQIMLVAGGSSLANFLQEVLDQRDHWIGQGYRPAEIACYYVRPQPEDYFKDQSQFDALAPKTAKFYQARPDLIYQHISMLARRRPKALYIYTTSHGLQPDADRDDYTLVYSSDPAEPASSKEYRFVTPRALRRVLRKLPDATEKYVVLQACYSGGFIGEESQQYQDRNLRSVPNITILAASRHDRTSFGCGSAERYTYYGAAFLGALKGQSGKFDKLDYKRLARAAASGVTRFEQRKRIPIHDRSLPQMYTNKYRGF